MKHLYYILLSCLLFTSCYKGEKHTFEEEERYKFKAMAVQNLFDYLVGEDPGGVWSVCQQPTGVSISVDANTGIFDDEDLVCVAGDGLYCFLYTLDCPTCPGLVDTEEVWFEACCLEVTCSVDTPISCQGGSDGAVTVSEQFGTAPYTYSWDTAPVQTTQTATGLPAGTYTVVVTDDNGCTATCDVILDDSNAPVVVEVLATPDDILCVGETITLSTNITSGTAPYTYLWSTTETTPTIDVTTSGTYSVVVTDTNGCTGADDIVITDADPLIAVCRHAILPGAYVDGCVLELCEEDGFRDVRFNPRGTGWAAPAGTTHLWSTGATTQSLTLNNVKVADSGIYSVTVTSPQGCEDILDFTLTVFDQLDVTCVVTDTSCPEVDDGTVTSTVTNGTAPFTYLWSNLATTPNITGLPSGTYTLLVTDANGCTGACTADVQQGPSIIANIAGNLTICDDETTTLTASSNTSNLPETYLWSTLATTQDIIVSTAGTYTVTVTDNAGCTDEHTVNVVVNPTAVLACQYNLDGGGFVDGCLIEFCEDDGTRDVILSPAGTGSNIPAGSTYLWSNGSTNSSINLTNVTTADNGTYTVTVTTPDGCDSDISFTLNVFPAISVVCTGNDTSCPGVDDGTVTTVVTGGVGPFTYQWNTVPVQTTADATSLAPGTYTVTVTDSNNCTATCSATVNEGTGLNVTISGDLSYCAGESTTITANSNGTAPFTYNWSTLETTQAITVTSGTYMVTVTDNLGCTGEQTVNVTEDPLPTVSLVCANGQCGGLGSIDATPSGNAPFSYSWSNGATTQDLTGLSDGTYTLTVTDVNGCTATDQCTIVNEPDVVINCTGTDLLCNGDTNGTATVNVTDGTPAYVYSWSNGGSTATITNLTAGTYTVTVTDANLCTASCSYTVTEPSLLQATINCM